MKSPADLTTPTTLRDCGLAVALPLSRDAFLTDAASPSLDYVVGVVGERDVDVAWETSGAPVATLARNVIESARDLGVVVAAEATLSDVRRLFGRCSVVTIVAHWRGALLASHDVLCDPDAWLTHVCASTDEIVTRLEHEIHEMWDKSMALPLDELARRSQFAEVVNRTVLDSPMLFRQASMSDRDTVVDDLWLRSVNRAWLDRTFPEMFRPGNRLELRDGLHAAATVAEIVPEGWTGIVDFAICESAYLAGIVKGGRPERRVIMNTRPVIPDVRLRIQRALYELLDQRTGNYAAVLMSLFRGLRDLRTGG